MYRLVCGLFAVAMLAAVMDAPSAQAAEIKDHPAVSRYPGSVAVRRDEYGFKTYKLAVAIDPAGKTDDEIIKTISVEGNVVGLAYDNPKERSATEIFVNYKEGLETAGFEILFSCQDEACGPGWATSRWGRVTGIRYYSNPMNYLAAKFDDGEQTLYVAISVVKLRHVIDIVEVAEMERGLVTAQGIAEGLLTDGRVVLDGLYFDTDKATLKAESGEALGVIAQFLKDHGDLKVYIVGHTDSTGGFDHNMSLSKNRAGAVVKALTDDHGIAADRLSAHGVGPLSPAKSNAREEGKASNRRVEMVEQ